MDYRTAIESVERAMPHADVGETKRLADALMAAYEAGRTEREPLVPDAQGYLHITEFHYERLMADHARMDFLSRLADGRIYSATFSRSNICLTLRDGYEGTFRDCVDVAIKDANK